MQIRNGMVFCEDKQLRPCNVTIEGGTITALEEGTAGGEHFDAAGCYVLPGLVDIHTHGCVNEDFSDGSAQGWQKMSRAYASHGTTTFLGTTMTLGEDTLSAAMDVAAAFVPPEDGAACGGVHLEGPFLSLAKKGAQAGEFIHEPDVEMFRRLDARSGHQVRLVTVAPEEPHALEFIREVSKDCTVSLGHTTANYQQGRAAYECGADHLTHLFNAMPPLLHRDPGVIGAAADSGARAELICDGIHSHPAAVRCAWRIFGENLLLISDSMRCTGLSDGEYSLGGQPVIVKDGKATLLDGTIAGSSSFLIQCLQKALEFGLKKEDVFHAATAGPADSVGLGDRAGYLKAGRSADILVLNPDYSIRQVFVRGKAIL